MTSQTQNKHSKKRENTLLELHPISSWVDKNVAETKDKRFLFFVNLYGVDGLMMDSQDLSRLHANWRNFLHLDRSEEMQILYRRSNSFEKFFDQKLEAMNELRGDFSKRLYAAQLDNLTASVDELEVTEVECLLVFSVDFEKKIKMQRLEKLQRRREEILLKLESMGLEAQALQSEEAEARIMTAAQTRSYQSFQNIHEWPELSIKGQELKIEDETFRALQLKKLPEGFSEMGMIQALTLLPIPFELSIRFRGKDLEPVKRKIEKKRQLLFGLSSRKATGDPASETKFQEADELLRRLNEQSDSLLEMSLCVAARAKDQIFLRKIMSELMATASRLHQVEWEESSMCVFDSFLEMLPSFRGQIFNKHSVLSSNAVHFLPFFRPTAGEREKPVLSFKTQYGSIFSMNPISETAANYNWLVSGQSGAGKSFLVNSLLLQSLVLQPRIFVVDVGGSYNKLTEFLGGKLVRLDAEDGFSIGPFFAPKQTDAQQERKRRAQIELIFQEMLRDEGKLPNIHERALLSEILEPIFEKELPERPIQWVREQLQNSLAPEAKKMQLLLKRWAYPEFFGSFTDTNQSIDLSDDVICFDLKGIKEFPDLSRVIELIITSSIWSCLSDRKRFTWIVLDEVAFSLLRSQPGFVHELVSTCRKNFGGTCIVVQGIESLTTNPAGAAILANTNFKAILSQRGDPRGYQEPLNLSEPEIQAISSLDRKKGEYSDVFLMDDARRAVIRYTPDPLTYLLSTTDPADLVWLEEEMSNREGSFAEKILSLAEEGSE